MARATIQAFAFALACLLPLPPASCTEAETEQFAEDYAQFNQVPSSRLPVTRNCVAAIAASGPGSVAGIACAGV